MAEDPGTELELQDEHPERSEVLNELHEGLSGGHKRLPSKYFYDEQGSALFDRITELPEYYVTGTELSIMREHQQGIADALGEQVLLVELGSGSSIKVRLLLDVLRRPAGYVPVDISREHLQRAAEEISADYPSLAVLPVCADFMAPFELPGTDTEAARPVVYFPGSTIGNFDPPLAERLLRGVARTVGPGGRLLIGFDLRKDKSVMEAAYNDSAGVTAAFNLNLLARLNREFGADFDLDHFRHRAFFNDELGRIEMHLVSLVAQQVTLDGRRYAFRTGETIHTENSYKHTREGFTRIAGNAGMQPVSTWTDERDWFCVMLLEVA